MNVSNYQAFASNFVQDMVRGSTEQPWLETLTLRFYRDSTNQATVTNEIRLVVDLCEHTINSLVYTPVQINFQYSTLSLSDFRSFTAEINSFDPSSQPMILDTISRVSEDVRPADALYSIYRYDGTNYNHYQNIEAFIMGDIGFSISNNRVSIIIIAGEPNLEDADFPNTYFNSAQFPGIETDLGDPGTYRVKRNT